MLEKTVPIVVNLFFSKLISNNKKFITKYILVFGNLLSTAKYMLKYLSVLVHVFYNLVRQNNVMTEINERTLKISEIFL